MTLRPSRRRFSLPILLSLVAAAGCGAGGDGASAPGGGSAALPPPASVTVAWSLAAPGTAGRRDASVRVETTAALTGVQLDFEIPAECQGVAGAASRTVAAMLPGQPVNQGIGFQCPEGTKGSIRVRVSGKDAHGREVVTTSEGAL